MITKRTFEKTMDNRRQRSIEERSAEAALLDLLHLSSNDVVVEFGAGTGSTALTIAGRLREMRGLGLVIACDFSRKAVRNLAVAAADQGLKRQLRAICLDDLKPFSLPLGTARADSAVAVGSLHTLDDPLPYLCELGRILRPSGELFIADMRDKSPRDVAASPRRIVVPEHLHFLFREAGLEAGDTMVVGGYAWAIRAVKRLHLRPRARVHGLSLVIPRLSFAR
jgi:SAM-dependent methyltransferase